MCLKGRITKAAEKDVAENTEMDNVSSLIYRLKDVREWCYQYANEYYGGFAIRSLDEAIMQAYSLKKDLEDRQR